MKLQTTRALYDYWTRLRGNARAPFRKQVDPGAMRGILPDVFLLARQSHHRYPFRIAGTALCSYFGRELRDSDFLGLWSPGEREGLESLLLSVTEDCAGAVLGIRGLTADDRPVDLEVLLLPLRVNSEHCTQVVGSIAPFKREFWLGHKPITRQSIRSLRLLWPGDIPGPASELDTQRSPVTIDQPATSYRSGKPRLLVIEGGRTG